MRRVVWSLPVREVKYLLYGVVLIIVGYAIVALVGVLT